MRVFVAFERTVVEIFFFAGNTCYFNSVMQQLIGHPHFADDLELFVTRASETLNVLAMAKRKDCNNVVDTQGPMMETQPFLNEGIEANRPKISLHLANVINFRKDGRFDLAKAQLRRLVEEFQAVGVCLQKLVFHRFKPSFIFAEVPLAEGRAAGHERILAAALPPHGRGVRGGQ